jgi:hypothetical protein
VANLPPLVASSSCVDIPFFNTWLIAGLARMARELLPTDVTTEDILIITRNKTNDNWPTLS